MPKPSIKQQTARYDAEIGRRVRAVRKARNISQSQLAAALGIGFQQIQKYEHGTNRIGAGRLFMIAQFFDVPVTHFFPDHGVQKQALFSKEAVLTATLIDALRPPVRRDLIALVEAVHDEGKDR